MKRISFFIKNQINRSEFKICFIILILLSISGVVMGYCQNYKKDLMFIRSAADNFLLASTYARVIEMLFALLFPLLAASLCAGYKKGSKKNEDCLFSLLRMNKKQFVYGNAVVVVVMTIMVFMFTLILNQLLCLLAFPLHGADNRWGQPRYELICSFNPEYLFDIWVIQNPYIYNILYIIIISILAGGIALLTYGLGYLKMLERLKPIQLSAIVFIGFIMLFVISQFIGISGISFLSYVETGHSVSLTQYCIFTCFIYLAGLVLTIKGKEVYEVI